jgi:hypothetical protein
MIDKYLANTSLIQKGTLGEMVSKRKQEKEEEGEEEEEDEEGEEEGEEEEGRVLLARW